MPLVVDTDCANSRDLFASIDFANDFKECSTKTSPIVFSDDGRGVQFTEDVSRQPRNLTEHAPQSPANCKGSALSSQQPFDEQGVKMVTSTPIIHSNSPHCPERRAPAVLGDSNSTFPLIRSEESLIKQPPHSNFTCERIRFTPMASDRSNELQMKRLQVLKYAGSNDNSLFGNSSLNYSARDHNMTETQKEGLCLIREISDEYVGDGVKTTKSRNSENAQEIETLDGKGSSSSRKNNNVSTDMFNDTHPIKDIAEQSSPAKASDQITKTVQKEKANGNNMLITHLKESGITANPHSDVITMATNTVAQFKNCAVFKEPMCRTAMIPIKKGGKNWRRSVANFTNAGGIKSDNGTRRVGKSLGGNLVRKSTVIIEQKHRNPPSQHIDGDIGTFPEKSDIPEPVEIAEISIIQESSATTSKENNVNQQIATSKDAYTGVADNESNQSHESVLLTPSKTFDRTTTIKSKQNKAYNKMEKSASYIELIVDEQCLIGGGEKSFLTEPKIDAMEKILSKCTKREIVPFGDLYDEEILAKAKKVGEGSYGEVFLLHKVADDDPPVLKVVPVNGTTEVNGQSQTRLPDMLAEVVVSSELNKLKQVCNKRDKYAAPTFTQLRNCFLVEGSYPPTLLDKWDEYHTYVGSENDRPDEHLFSNTADQQHFVALEYANGGKDLEHIVLKNATEGLSIFHQVAYALAGTIIVYSLYTPYFKNFRTCPKVFIAVEHSISYTFPVAERAFQFEHRDLHWGNILVRPANCILRRTGLWTDFIGLDPVCNARDYP